MSFDPNTAQPAAEPKKSFDSSTAKKFDPGSAKPGGELQPVSPGSHRLQGVDYSEGLSFPVRAALSQADNQQEKLLMLGQVYGKDNVKVASDGSLVVKKDGKMIAVEGGSGLKNFAADLVGNAPQLAGIAAGATMGAEFGPWGVAGGAVIGAMFGKEGQEINKIAQGRFAKTGKEEAGTLVQAGEEGLGGELGGRAVTGVVSKVLRGGLPRVISGTTRATNAMTDRMLAGGARPAAQETMPNLKHVQFMETLADKVGGPVKAQQAANEKYIGNRMASIFQDAGVPRAQIKNMMGELASGESQVPTAEIGAHIQTTLKAHQEMLENQFSTTLRDLNGKIDSAFQYLDKATGKNSTEGLALQVSEKIQAAKQEFGDTYAKLYGKIDGMVGGQPLVPSFGVNKVAEDILNSNPSPIAKQAMVKELASIGVDLGKTGEKKAGSGSFAEWSKGKSDVPKMTFAQAQRIRTLLRERLDGGLTSNIAQHEWGLLKDSVDQAIQLAAHDPEAAPAVKLLNQADKGYGEGIRKFTDSTIKGLVHDMRTGIPANPEVVAAKILQPGQMAKVREIRAMIGPENWSKVRGADYTNLIRASQDQTGNVSGIKLLGQIQKRGALMEEVYGSAAKDIKSLAQAIAVRDGALPAESLLPGRVKDTLMQLKMEEKQLDDYMRKNVLSDLSDPKKPPEMAYKWLVNPQHGDGLKKAIEHFGENSETVKGIRQTALKELLTTTKVNLANKNSADALSKALAGYTKQQQDLLFPKGMAADIGLLGKEVESLMKPLEDKAMASMAAGAILHADLLTRIPIQIPLAIYQVLLSKPSTIRYLALGLRSESGPIRKGTKEMLKDLVRNGVLTSDPDTKKEGQPK